MITARTQMAIIFLGTLVLAACSSSPTAKKEAVLLYGGIGSSKNDTIAVEKLVRQCGFECVTIGSSQLNDMSENELSRYRLIVIAGGNYIEMGNSLAPETAQRLRQAVSKGLNYLGICAGGLLAGDADCNSFNLTAGVKFGFYEIVNRDIHKSVVQIVDANSHSIEHYWEDGPEFSGWGQVVGKYPDETPAVVTGSFGKGRVVLCGVHPEAPGSWRKDMVFTSSPREANEFGKSLIRAAIAGMSLPHFHH